MQPTVFYAWQSDADKAANRFFIREVAKDALKKLKSSGSVEESPRLDHDTRGIAGTPEIAGTIFQKIKTASLFLADVTLVGHIQPDKPTPNPNVLVELGYAAAIMGWDRVILTMNMHYGPPENLPFDLKHRRFPLTYTLAPGADENDSRAKLGEGLVGAFQAAMNAEHDAVQRAVGQLTNGCMELMSKYGLEKAFQIQPPKTMGQSLIFISTEAAIERLLTLGLVQLDFRWDAKTQWYTWTYLADLVLREVGLRD